MWTALNNNSNGDTDDWLTCEGAGAGLIGIAVGFKFGTVLGSNGDSLSHVQLHGEPGGTVVPEPGTLALLGLGLIGLVLIRRRKRR